MAKFHFEKLLQKSGWKKDVLIETDSEGTIVLIEYGVSPDDAEYVKGLAIPGFPNGHSHAFQYAMAGMAEIHPQGLEADDFWSWRNAMYDLALSLQPDEMEAIACMLYAEMLRHGYTQVTEFHYLHHDQDGRPYENLAAMGERLARAAFKTGISLTLIPIFYQRGGFGKEALVTQRRFLSANLDEYLKLLEATDKLKAQFSNLKVGVGVHSLRGVQPELISEVFTSTPHDIPFHIHIAEQLKEVEECQAYLGKRPVEWLSNALPLNSRTHLVHATHLTSQEVSTLAQSGCNIVICPSTEGNLGDGFFPLNEFSARGGKWSIGTDSHIGLNPFEELRLLDYGQRMRSHSRLTFAGKNGDSGGYAIQQAVLNGRKAGGIESIDYFEIGQPLDALILNEKSPLLQSAGDRLLTSSILYTSDSSMNQGTLARGRWVVKEGVHILYDEISTNFHQAMKKLGKRTINS